MAPVLFHPLSGRAFNHKALHKTLGNSTTVGLITNSPTHMQYSQPWCVREACQRCNTCVVLLCWALERNVDELVCECPLLVDFGSTAAGSLSALGGVWGLWSPTLNILYSPSSTHHLRAVTEQSNCWLTKTWTQKSWIGVTGGVYGEGVILSSATLSFCLDYFGVMQQRRQAGFKPAVLFHQICNTQAATCSLWLTTVSDVSDLTVGQGWKRLEEKQGF